MPSLPHLSPAREESLQMLAYQFQRMQPTSPLLYPRLGSPKPISTVFLAPTMPYRFEPFFEYSDAYGCAYETHACVFHLASGATAFCYQGNYITECKDKGKK